MKQIRFKITGNIYDLVWQDEDGFLCEYTLDQNKNRCWITKNDFDQFYEEHKEPVVEVRYGRAVMMDYTAGDWDCFENSTSWTRKKTMSDNIKATWTDDVLTSVEIIKCPK